jgi:CheY-like chemotaxis protein
MPHTDGGAREPARVLVVNVDTSLAGLLDEWLAPCGCEVVQHADDDDLAQHDLDIAVVDVPFPRQGGLALLQRIAAAHPGKPIVALSSTFFSGIECNGAVARALGVTTVLPMPVSREALTTAVRDLLQGK